MSYETRECEQRLRRIVDAYDAYRGKGMLPAPGQYAAMVAAIEEARLLLANREVQP